MSSNSCQKCGEVANLETSPFGDLCGICEKWVCKDCIDWKESGKEHNFICKECSSKLY